jgi:microsomal dipeptidase-like Zn-dependent dipeptidase
MKCNIDLFNKYYDNRNFNNTEIEKILDEAGLLCLSAYTDMTNYKKYRCIELIPFHTKGSAREQRKTTYKLRLNGNGTITFIPPYRRSKSPKFDLEVMCEIIKHYTQALGVLVKYGIVNISDDEIICTTR